ncbi:unnamed protein product [Alopecurus aequalis]
MNLTLSLGVDGAATAKKRKVRDGVEVGGAGDGGDRARVMRLLQARDRLAKVELYHHDDDAGAEGGLRLMRLLLSSAAAGEVGDTHAAAVALREVYRHASFRAGEPVQRVAAYFADALASRLLLPSPPPAATTTRAEQFLALTMFYQASPLYQFAHFTANQAIVEAFEAGGRRRLHVVDFDFSFGFQWPSLIQSLSDAATNSSSHDDSGDYWDEPVSLRITGFGTSASELRDTEARLTRFADGCPNLRFEFEGVVNDGPEDVRHNRINVDLAATVVVNLVFPAAASSRESRSTLAFIRSLDPSLVFLIDKADESNVNGATRSRNSASLLPRFAASLRYYAAVFESLHECLPADSAERLAIERDHLGVEISDAMAASPDHCHSDRVVDWTETLERAGFEGARLTSRTVSQAKLLLKMKSGGCGGGFRVIEDGGGKAMSLGWRDRALITASAWRPCRRSVGKRDL